MANLLRPAGHARRSTLLASISVALLVSLPACSKAQGMEANLPTIPAIQTTALDGHAVSLPAALPAGATVLILGFGRHSSNATTAWEKPVRMQLAHPPAIGFFDMAMLAEIPSFAHSFALRSIRKQVPDVLKPNFLPIFDHEDDWKRVVGYTHDQPEAAYVILVDKAGRVRWSTHEAFSPAVFNTLRTQAQRLGNE